MKFVNLLKTVACCAAFMAFAISFHSCSKSSLVQTPEDEEIKVVAIPYTVSVGSDDTGSSSAPQTRATINSSKKYVTSCGSRSTEASSPKNTWIMSSRPSKRSMKTVKTSRTCGSFGARTCRCVISTHFWNRTRTNKIYLKG